MPEFTAVIIGSGFGNFASGEPQPQSDNRFGSPSAAIKLNQIGGTPVLSLARHGDKHTIPPHAINYRANMLALHEAGARFVIAVNTVGVISGIRNAGQIAVPDQLTDYTWGREHTIFDGANDEVEHIDFTEPFSAAMRTNLLRAAKRCNVDCYDGGVYATTQGPRLETAAEVDRFEREGADFLGMTAMPEAAIARELGLQYVCLALIVNQAAGRGAQSIHADFAENIGAAVADAEAVLQQYFGDS